MLFLCAQKYGFISTFSISNSRICMSKTDYFFIEVFHSRIIINGKYESHKDLFREKPGNSIR